MAVCVCVALDLSVSGFRPSGVDCIRLEVSWSRDSHQIIADAIQHIRTQL